MKTIAYVRQKEWIAFFIGIAVTALYIIFATPIYDLIYPGTAQFGNDMYNLNMYMIVAILTSSIVWVIAACYYLLLDNWSGFTSWLCSFLLAVFCAPTISYVYPNGEFHEMNIEMHADLVNFAIANLLVTAVLYFVISICIKGLSRNCSTSPF